jgi:hypothetical protein
VRNGTLGLLAHVTLSVSWGIVLARVLPPGHRAVTGLFAGAVFGAVMDVL